MTITSGPNLGLMINAALGEQHYIELVRFLRGMDGLIQPSVSARQASAPTSGLVEGLRYLNTTDNKIYRYTTYLSPAAWEAYQPQDGWFVWSVADQKGYRFKAGVWAADASSGGGGFTNPMTDAGDLIVGGNAGEPSRLPKGAAGKILSSTASGLAWIDAPTSGGGSAEKYSTASPTNARVILTDTATTVWGITLSSNAELFLPTYTGGGVVGLALIISQDTTGGRTMTWPSSITWNGGSAPTLLATANSKTLVSLLSVDGGSTWLGMTLTQASSGGGGSFVGGKLTKALDEPDIQTISPFPTTINLDNVTSNTIQLNGTTGNLNSLTGGNVSNGMVRRILFNDSGATVNHLAGNIRLPGKVPIKVRAGDVMTVLQTDSSEWKCIDYQRAQGVPLYIPPTALNFAGGVLDVSAMVGDTVTINPGGGTALTGISEEPFGALRTLIFRYNGLAVTHDATKLIMPGGVTQSTTAGDKAEFISLGSGNWECLWYARADGKALVGGAGSGDLLKDGSVAMTGAFNEAVPRTAAATSGVIDMDFYNVNTILVSDNSGNITSFTGGVVGGKRTLIFNSAGPVLKYASSTMVLPGGNDITVRAGDVAEFEKISDTKWKCLSYDRADGTMVATKLTDALSEATIAAISTPASENINSAVIAANTYSVTGAGAISYLNNNQETGAIRRMIFNTAGITLRHLGGNLKLPGAVARVTQVGDVAEFVQDTNTTWRCFNYSRADSMNLPIPMVRLPTATATLDVGAAASPVVDVLYQDVQTITSLGTAPAGTRRTITRTGRNAQGQIGQDTAEIFLTHNSDTLVLPDGKTFPLTVNATLDVISLGGGKWHTLTYKRGDGDLQLGTGSLDATPVEGKLEYDGTNLYFVAGSTRMKVSLVTV